MAQQTKTTTETKAASDLATNVREGLTRTPKRVSSRFLYDEAGSRLFEAICSLPEYYLTRAETEILESHANDIAARFPPAAKVVEFGAGSAVKTRILLAALAARHGDALTYCPIDISEEAMRSAEANVRAEFPGIAFDGIVAEYADAAQRLSVDRAHAKLVVFLGSSIGNFTHDDAVGFLCMVRGALTDPEQDRLLIGMDTAKDVDVLLAAYDDGAGVTAAFDKNLLNRINRELVADFDAHQFRHEARWNAKASRIEMHLVSLREQTVHIGALDLMVHFDEGESIHTENSHKYSSAERDAILAEAGFTIEAAWADAAERYGLYLARPV